MSVFYVMTWCMYDEHFINVIESRQDMSEEINEILDRWVENETITYYPEKCTPEDVDTFIENNLQGICNEHVEEFHGIINIIRYENNKVEVLLNN